ncbi:MAG: discoidin protein [Fibrobacteres bacterium]|nr:discoidin protein [Fibrobacterota bacterium]
MARTLNKILRIGLLAIFASGGKVSALQFTDGAAQLTIDAAKYQIAFDKTNGGIAWIIDKSTNGKVTYGDRGSLLWFSRAGGSPTEFIQSKSCAMTYAWQAATNSLTFKYTGAMTVDVNVTASDAEWIELAAQVTNTRAAVIDTFSFPSDLLIDVNEVKDAFFPRDPGITISKPFFTTRKSFAEIYPGHISSDFLAVQTTNGSLALYSKGKDKNLEMAMIGYVDPGTGTVATMQHRFACSVAPGQTRIFPPMAIRIGETYIKSGMAYRTDNGFDKFPSLSEKLGVKKDRFFGGVAYKWNMPAVNMSFAVSKAGVIDKLPLPGILIPVTFQNAKHDELYPDFLPPNPLFGTTEQMKDMVAYAHQKGSLVYPYVNFSWWDVNSPTLKNLPAGTTLASLTSRPETYNGTAGITVVPDHPFVLERTMKERDLLCGNVGLDGLLEDQWGVHSMASTAHFNGVQKNLAAGKAYNLGTECGIDVQAQYLATFFGSMYDWDVRWPSVVTPYATFFPMWGVMLRDKVLTYQHGLSQIGWTHSKAMVRWNLALGFQLSSTLFISEASPTSPAPEDFPKDGLHIEDNPWIKVAGVFQKHVLSRYADELITDYQALGNGIFKTSFRTFTTYSSWNNQPYAVNGHTISANGVATISNNGSAVAGVFTAFNGSPLSAGDHYIAMVRDSTSIKLFHPKGAATPITLTLPPEWKTYTMKSYSLGDAPIGDVPFTKNGQTVTFTAAENLNGGPGGYYRLVSDQVASGIPGKPTLNDDGLPAHITVYDGFGKIVLDYQSASANPSNPANLGKDAVSRLGSRAIGLPRGTYFMKVESKAGTSVRKILAGRGRAVQAPSPAQARGR